MCPLRFYANTSDLQLASQLAENFPALIPPNQDTVFRYRTDKKKEEIQISFSVTMGNPKDSINPKAIKLPFPMGKSYKIIQGYQGSYSHNSDYSRYAIDFSLAEGDTICVVADGVVVGVIEGYKHGGDSEKWRDYANFITVFHPDMNLFTQYVHLMYMGSLVEVGDEVKAGESIALAGKTGFTDIEHLHFNVLRASEDGIVSYPIDFDAGYQGRLLKRGDYVQH